MNHIDDLFVGLSIAGAAYEVGALLSGGRVVPPLTTLAHRWRDQRNPLVLAIAITWLGLGWHLFLER